MQGSENEVSHAGLGNKTWGRGGVVWWERGLPYLTQPIIEGLEDKLQKKILAAINLPQITKGEEQHGFGHTSQLYSSSQDFLFAQRQSDTHTQGGLHRMEAFSTVPLFPDSDAKNCFSLTSSVRG